jgi:hypothetical protein
LGKWVDTMWASRIKKRKCENTVQRRWKVRETERNWVGKKFEPFLHVLPLGSLLLSLSSTFPASSFIFAPTQEESIEIIYFLFIFSKVK